MFQKAGAVILILIGALIGIGTFIFAFDIYPADCTVFIAGPIHDSCIEFNTVEKYNFTSLNGNYRINFYVNVPEFTPDTDKIYLETEFGNYEMQNKGNGLWYTNLTYKGEMKYRYNRNDLSFLSAEQFEPDNDNAFRTVVFETKPKEQKDVVKNWRYLSGRVLENIPSSASVRKIAGRESFDNGCNLVEYWLPAFLDLMNDTSKKMKSNGIDTVMISVKNPYSQIEPLPVIETKNADYISTIKQQINIAKQNGLRVTLKSKLCCNNAPNKAYSDAWWNSWFENTRKVLLEDARIAQDTNADSLLIDYTYGNSILGEFYAPRFAGDRWNAILKEMKLVYKGNIGFNTFISGNYTQLLFPWPDGVRRFSTEVDFYGIEVWTGIADTPDVSQDLLNANAETIISKLITATKGYRKPIIITGLAYPSVHKSELGESGVNSATAGLQAFEVQNPSLVFDSREQAMIYEAYLNSIAVHPEIFGLYDYGYSFVDLPDAVDYSIRGKEAEKIVKEWYSVL